MQAVNNGETGKKFPLIAVIDCLWCGRRRIAELRYNDQTDVIMGCICDCEMTTLLIVKPGKAPVMKKKENAAC